MQTIRRAIVIGNGVAGAENQSIGLVRALGFSDKYTLYRVTRPRGGINESLHWLPVSVHKNLDHAVNCFCDFSRFRRKKLMPLPDQGKDVLEADAGHISKLAHESFNREGPILLVASGHDTIGVASSIKQLVPENVFLVQVLTVGALHPADSVALIAATSAWQDKIAPLPKPLIVVSIGGPIRHCIYGADVANQLTASLKRVLPTCGSLRISFSRPTPKIVSEIVLREFTNHPKVYIWNDPNPHMGHLAWADTFIITADSVSMLSEACSTGKRVYVIGAERCTWKFEYFLKSLLYRGAVRPFTGEEDVNVLMRKYRNTHQTICMSETWQYCPLRDTEEAASEVIKALSKCNWRLLSE